jgi:hypothetical protein
VHPDDKDLRTTGADGKDAHRLGFRVAALPIQLSVDTAIIRHRECEQRQITLSVNDLQISCRTSYSPSVA